MLKPDAPERNEHELRSLFQTMRQADAQRAPSFIQVTQTATRAVGRRRHSGWLRPAMAVAAVAAVILVVVSVSVLRQSSDAPPVAQQQRPAPVAAVPSSVPVNVATAPATKPAVTRRPKRVIKPSVPSISEWKSPTEALLKTPGDDLRTTLPKIGYTPSTPPSAE